MDAAHHPDMSLHPRQMFEFLLASGVDVLVGEEAVNRFAMPEALAQPAAMAPIAGEQKTTRTVPAPRLAAARPPPLAPDEAVMSARKLAASAPDLVTLEAMMRDFEGCTLKSTASRLVFADGNPCAKVMIVGEAPGREEDEVGRPFVGRAGHLLDLMLAAIGLDRTQVYIANVVPWRPPGNRTPTPQELAICLPFVTRQIALCAPQILMTMGAPAAQTLLNQREGILRLRGQWFDYQAGDNAIPALVTLHPAYLLRQPAQKALAWRDLRAVQARLASLD